MTASALTDLAAEMRAEAERLLVLVEDNPAMDESGAVGLCMRAKRLQAWATRLDALAQAWVSVEDRLPDEGQHIVGSNADGGMWTEYFSRHEPPGRMQWWASLPPIPPLTPTGAKS